MFKHKNIFARVIRLLSYQSFLSAMPRPGATPFLQILDDSQKPGCCCVPAPGWWIHDWHRAAATMSYARNVETTSWTWKQIEMMWDCTICWRNITLVITTQAIAILTAHSLNLPTVQKDLDDRDKSKFRSVLAEVHARHDDPKNEEVLVTPKTHHETWS